MYKICPLGETFKERIQMRQIQRHMPGQCLKFLSTKEGIESKQKRYKVNLCQGSQERSEFETRERSSIVRTYFRQVKSENAIKYILVHLKSHL